MPHLSMPVLGSLSDVLFPLIFLIVAVISWLTKAVGDNKKKSGLGGTLGEMLNQKREQANPPSTAHRDEPNNLTMAQRIERARAKAQYEARANQLRQQSQPSPQQSASASSAQGGAAMAQRAQATELAQQQRQRMQRQARELRQRSSRPRAAQPQPAKPVPRQATAATRQPRAAQNRSQGGGQAPNKSLTDYRRDTNRRQRMTVEQQEAILAAESAIMQDIAHLTPRTRHKDSARMIALRGSLRSANAMRDAYVLKEILDKPLALRDPQAERAAT